MQVLTVQCPPGAMPGQQIPVQVPPPQMQAPAYHPSPHKCQGTTTAQESYPAWKVDALPPPSAQPRLVSPHKFTATSHNQDTYRAWKIEPAAAPQALRQTSASATGPPLV